MPTYSFINEKTKEEFTEFMSMAEREAFLSDNPHIRQLPSKQMNIVSGTSVNKALRTDDGWREQLARIAEANPNSKLGEQYGAKSVKAVKTRDAVEKWRKKRATDTL